MTIEQAIEVLGDTKLCSPLGQACFVAIQALRQQQERAKGCEYTQTNDDGNVWQCSGCGVEWVLEAGTPKENEMDYCPKCGLPIIGERTQPKPLICDIDDAIDMDYSEFEQEESENE